VEGSRRERRWKREYKIELEVARKEDWGGGRAEGGGEVVRRGLVQKALYCGGVVRSVYGNRESTSHREIKILKYMRSWSFVWRYRLYN
jgi:hypothetical protein